jgi:hypothetical protein
MIVLGETFGEETTLTSRTGPRQDSVDRHVALWERELPWMDPLHEQVVARLMLLTKHLARSREAAFADDDLGRASFKVLLALRRLGSPYTAQPSELAEQLGLSRGACRPGCPRSRRTG